MTFTRITKIGVLMLGVALLPMTAKAGFEFSGAQAPAKAPQRAPEDSIDAPMPIVPTGAVTAEPLQDGGAMPMGKPVPQDETSAMQPGHTLQAPAHYQKNASDEVYIRRQRSEVALKAPKNGPMDTAGMLKATEDGRMIELEGEPRQNLAAPAQDGQLVINPYPLESEQGASHGDGMGQIATEQALMEQGGHLRAVAVPGKTAPGMIARANMTSRYDTASRYLERPPAMQDAEVMGLAATSSMTPIPGGEGAPLPKVSKVSATPLPPPASMQAPAAPAPIAMQPMPAPMENPPMQMAAAANPPAMPMPRAPMEAKPEPAPAKPMIAQRVSAAEPSMQPMPPVSQASAAPQPLMPRPAVPEGRLQPSDAIAAPAQQMAAAATPMTGGFTEAVGFGRDLPLALALSQIVPPEYSYAFGPDVNVGSIVSWQGGKPWNEVLNDTLATQGLRAAIAGNKIMITKDGRAA